MAIAGQGERESRRAVCFWHRTSVGAVNRIEYRGRPGLTQGGIVDTGDQRRLAVPRGRGSRTTVDGIP